MLVKRSVLLLVVGLLFFGGVVLGKDSSKSNEEGGEGSSSNEDSGDDSKKCIAVMKNVIEDLENTIDLDPAWQSMVQQAYISQDDENDEKKDGNENSRRKRSSGSYGDVSGFFPSVGNVDYGSYGRYGNFWGYNRNAYVNSPMTTFVKSFQPGGIHLEGSQVVHDFYKRGTYEVAKRHFMALPIVRIVPVKTTQSVDYVGHIQSRYGYNVRLCRSCHQGYPQIELTCNTKPYSRVIRRFSFLPQTFRTKTEYGTAEDFTGSFGYHAYHGNRH